MSGSLSDAEYVIAIAFLFGFILCFVTWRERSQDVQTVRLFLIGNAALSSLLFLINSGIGFRSAIFYAALALGATEASYWAAWLANNILTMPDRPNEDHWAWKNDKAGCALSLVCGSVFLAFLALNGASTE